MCEKWLFRLTKKVIRMDCETYWKVSNYLPKGCMDANGPTKLPVSTPEISWPRIQSSTILIYCT